MKDRIYPVVFMAVITAICIALVSGVFLSTQELVIRNETLYLKRAVLYAAGIKVPENGPEAARVFDERVREVKTQAEQKSAVPETLYYEIVSLGGSIDGYVIETYGPGLWGEIGAVIGFHPDLRTMMGIDFIKQNETPGLGARITESWFKEQFRGKTGPFVMVEEGRSSKPNEVDAITGATRTSAFVLKIINGGSLEVEGLIERGGPHGS
jgi:Na+-transporting NADH:ubiquinone oxidoreductase subunit C